MRDIVHARVIESNDDSSSLKIGPASEHVLKMIPPDARANVEVESLRVLARAAASSSDTSAPSSSAQLVVGEVQSGKTLSFTTVMALARDNGYPLIVVVAGTKRNLLQQTERRLKNDLRLTGDGGANPWRTWTNPTAADASDLFQLLSQWSDARVPSQFRQTAVIFVLKHSSRLDSVAELLESVFVERRVPAVRALIIDDEADQASLNLKAAKNAESSVYSSIRNMREKLSNHTYLMYTATPQAPLLVSIEDALAPDKVTVLTAGAAYVGSRELFLDSRQNFLREISRDELETALDPAAESPPKSLVDALAFWALALVVSQERAKPRPFTMLVHPASTQDLHKKYATWVRGILDTWKVALSDLEDVAYIELRDEVFVHAYHDLRRTVPELPELSGGSDRLDEMLTVGRYYLNQIEQRVVNSETLAEIPEDEWMQFPGWIVIGGNKLDRGFTVQNLGVTYMPRGKGVGNVDTIQQRGRFFGYKRPYLDLLRGWLSVDVARAFTAYVEHERTMQQQLRSVDLENSSLKSWKRKFLLDPELKLTRGQVMTLPTVNSVIGRGWAFRQVELYTPDLASANVELVSTLREVVKTSGGPHSEDLRPGGKHQIASWNLKDCTQLLYDWTCSPSEKEHLDKIIYLLTSIHDNESSDPFVDVILMDGLESRRRSPLDPSQQCPQRINNLFQGRGSTNNYIGDERFHRGDSITLQLHIVDLQHWNQYGALVPALALALPQTSTRRVFWEPAE